MEGTRRRDHWAMLLVRKYVYFRCSWVRVFFFVLFFCISKNVYKCKYSAVEMYIYKGFICKIIGNVIYGGSVSAHPYAHAFTCLGWVLRVIIILCHAFKFPLEQKTKQCVCFYFDRLHHDSCSRECVVEFLFFVFHTETKTQQDIFWVDRNFLFFLNFKHLFLTI